jgi:glyceraldehyde 3-phosphate dehydrogenase
LEEDKYPDAKYFVIDKLKNAKDSEEIQKMLYCMVWTYWSFLLARELMSKTGKGANCAYVPL